MNTAGPRRTLSLFDTVAIIVGIVIGAGIFSFPSLVAGALPNAGAIIAVWLTGGVISMIGALCFAELATAFPDPGGEYHFLSRAYGRTCGFMYAWARMTVIQTGSIATLAFVYGDYAVQLLPLGPYGASLHAAIAITALTLINVAGIREAKWFQNVMAVAIVLGLGSLVAAGLAGPAAAPAPPDAGEIGLGAVGLAMVFVLFTYGGWNEAAYVSAEVRDASRTMVRALLLGLGLVTLIYVLANFAFLRVLGVSGIAGSKALGVDVIRAIAGEGGVVFITILVMIVVLTSINVTILTGARTSFAVGRDFRLFRFLNAWTEEGGQPVRAILLQSAIALALVGLGTVNREGVKTMVEYLSPVFWLFFLLIGISVFVLRAREPHAERPFRIPFYPVTPIIFCLASTYLLYSSLSYTGMGALAGVGVLALGLPVLAVAMARIDRGGNRT